MWVSVPWLRLDHQVKTKGLAAWGLGVLASIGYPAPGFANNGFLQLFEQLHWRQNVNAVYFDGGTCLESPVIWNAPSTGNVFFRAFWVAPDVGEETNQLIYATGPIWTPITNPDRYYISNSLNPDGMILSVFEQGGELVLHFWGFDGANHVETTAQTLTAPIAHNGLFHGVAVYVDTWNLTGQFIVVEEGGAHVEGGQLEVWADYGPTQAVGPPFPPQTGGVVSWDSVQHWYMGCNGVATSSWLKRTWLKGSLAEVYGDLTHEWILPTALGLFSSEDGYAIGLSQDETAHDCSAPWNGTFVANECSTGGPHFFPNGPFQPPSTGYQWNTLSGALRLADHDPCLMRGVDGCLNR